MQAGRADWIPGPLLTNHDFFHFPFRIPFRPASGQPGDYFYENYVSTPSTAPWLLGSIPRARSVQAVSLSHSPLLLVSSPFSLSLFVSVRNSFWNRTHDIYNSPSGIPSGIPYFPFREPSGIRCFFLIGTLLGGKVDQGSTQGKVKVGGPACGARRVGGLGPWAIAHQT